MKKGIYKHFKGNEYELICIANHSETLQKMVVYKALYGNNDIWVRPIEMWNEEVEFNGETVKRFTFVRDK